MYHPEAVVGMVAVVAAMGLVGRMLINTVARNVLRIKAAAAPPLPAPQEQRMAQMEAEIAALKDEVSRLSAVETFYAQLQAPRAPGQPFPPPTGVPGASR